MEVAPIPKILTTTVGSYPVPDWLTAAPSRQARLDATRVVFDIQRQAGIDLPTDGELYRFDISHPDTNGMIEYFLRPMSGLSTQLGRADWDAYYRLPGVTFRSAPAGVVTGAIGGGKLNLLADCATAAEVAGGAFKFTVTSPYMLSRLLLDQHYHDFEALTMAVAKALGEQVAGLPCACLQVDEAVLVENPEHALMAAKAINVLLDSVSCQRAVHLCFGNYGGQTIRQGHWASLLEFFNALHADHLVLEIAHRPSADLDALKDITPRIKLGIGVVDVKINRVETADEIAHRIEAAEKALGPERVGWVHPDCGFWMLNRSVVDRKIAALVQGRDLYQATESRTAKG
ncbi:MAG: cobalamin-independent methionine synthase II family protein [Terriglobia bacterium]|jgi:5-methyltetrahydropteroyltriglutamate--homocysteine methyltransferase